MNLPVKISPCPIIQAVVEIRFEPSVPSDAVFGLVYQALAKDFPKTTLSPLSTLPPEVRKADPNLALQPLHMLEGDELNVGIGDQSLTFGMKGQYPGWNVISGRFKNAVKQVISSNVIKRPSRFGLRYINFFPGDIFENFTLSLSIADKLVPAEGTFIKTVLQSGKYKLLLQVGKDLQVPSSGAKTPGCVIDIDAFSSDPDVTSGIGTSFEAFLEEAHGEEKKLFFGLLKEEFVKKNLNPAYE